MNRACPRCTRRFEREPGYFLGAMHFSCFLAVPIVMACVLGVGLLAPSWPLAWRLVVGWAASLPLCPLIFRGSRIAFIHLDDWVDPDASGEGP